jgi:hypothetical protein
MSQVRYTRPDTDWSVSGTLELPSLSGASQTRFTGLLHTVLHIPDAVYLPPLHLECLSSVILVLMPSRAS